LKIKNQMKLSFLSVPENLPLARVTGASFASQLDFTLEDVEDIKVVISEAGSNSIIHRYENDANRTVSLICTIYDDEILEIAVEDEGIGIADISQALQPAYSTVTDRMGLGFTFMQSFMDRLDVQSTVNQGTRVIMTKRVQSNAAAATEEN